MYHTVLLLITGSAVALMLYSLWKSLPVAPTARKPSWAQQRRADRALWSGMQREAMQQWEERCQCPEPRVFLDYRTGKPLDNGWQEMNRRLYPGLSKWPRAPRRDNFDAWLRDRAKQYERYEA